jgi:peptidoglycan hydrolase-like protein with peptidoglycan-binding domain
MAEATGPSVEEEQMLKLGDTGKTVTHYQERLMQWRSTALPVNGADGDYGTETETWVESFQVTEELESTGNIDGLTAARLDSYALDLVDAKLRRDLIAVQQESRNADATLEAGKADTDHTHGFTGTTEPADP